MFETMHLETWHEMLQKANYNNADEASSTQSFGKILTLDY